MQIGLEQLVEILDEDKSRGSLRFYNAGITQDVTIPVPGKDINLLIQLTKPEGAPQIEMQSGSSKEKLAALLMTHMRDNPDCVSQQIDLDFDTVLGHDTKACDPPSDHNGFNDRLVQLLERQHKVPVTFRKLFSHHLDTTRYALKQLPDSAQRQLEDVPIALLPTGDINAWAVVTDDREYIIVEAALISLLDGFTILFSHELWHGSGKEECYEEILEKSQLLLDLIACVLAGDFERYVLTSNQLPKYASERSLEPPFRIALMRSMVCFIIGHEYGHMALGHFGPLRAACIGGSDYELKIRQRLQKEELDADEWGAHFATSWVDAVDLLEKYDYCVAIAQSTAEVGRFNSEELLRGMFQRAAPHLFMSLVGLVNYCEEEFDRCVSAAIGVMNSPVIGVRFRERLRVQRSLYPAERQRHDRLHKATRIREHVHDLGIALNGARITERIMYGLQNDLLSRDTMVELIPKRLMKYPSDIRDVPMADL